MKRVKSILRSPRFKATLLLGITNFVLLFSYAQSGNAGINSANTQVRSYFADGTNLMYAVGGIVGLIGAVKVYQKWNSGDQDINKELMGWGGSCVFLVVSALVIKAFFGL